MNTMKPVYLTSSFLFAIMGAIATSDVATDGYVEYTQTVDIIIMGGVSALGVLVSIALYLDLPGRMFKKLGNDY